MPYLGKNALSVMYFVLENAWSFYQLGVINKCLSLVLCYLQYEAVGKRLKVY